MDRQRIKNTLFLPLHLIFDHEPMGQRLYNTIFFPLRVLLNHRQVKQLGLISLQEERINICKRYSGGKVLDMGCGDQNLFIKALGHGIGLDIYPWGGINIRSDGAQLPFKDQAFDTVVFLGSLNYLRNVEAVLRETHRVLNNKGVILIVQSNPIIGFLRLKLCWWVPYRHECYGFWKKEIDELLDKAGFFLTNRVSFLLSINKLYIARKK